VCRNGHGTRSVPATLITARRSAGGYDGGMDDENPYRSPSLAATAGDGQRRSTREADGREVVARRVIAVVLFGFAVLLFGRTVAAIEAARIAPSLILLSAVAATLLCWLGLNVWREVGFSRIAETQRGRERREDG
jgi:threonine/homoserine/homoserine lactone efflux protein